MPLSPREITALKYKFMDFIQENDPFGDKISQHELLCLAQYFADAATARAGVVGCPVCEVCKRSVLGASQLGAGWIAPCGQRLVDLSECGTAPECRGAVSEGKQP